MFRMMDGTDGVPRSGTRPSVKLCGLDYQAAKLLSKSGFMRTLFAVEYSGSILENALDMMTLLSMVTFLGFFEYMNDLPNQRNSNERFFLLFPLPFLMINHHTRYAVPKNKAAEPGTLGTVFLKIGMIALDRMIETIGTVTTDPPLRQYGHDRGQQLYFFVRA
jgi:hypothetical protein